MTSVTHNVRMSLLVNEHEFTLTDDALTCDADGKLTTLPYNEIMQIGLLTYAGAGGLQGQATIKSKSGRSIKIRSHHYVSLGLFENRSSTYAPLLRELGKRVSRANPSATFKSGSALYWYIWLALFIMCIAIAALLSMALLSGEELKGNVIGGMIAMIIFVPVTWRSMKNSKQGAFDPNDVPSELIEM